MKLFLVFTIFLGIVLSIVGCDKKEACLDSAGCWDTIDGVCRKNESNAQQLCNRTSKSFSTKPYLEDFEALKAHISKSYANLEDLIEYYKIDPYELNKQTISRIKASTGERQAIEALMSFVATFKDGHFKLRKPKKDESINKKNAKAPMANSTPAKEACEALGFTWEKDFDFKFPVKGVKVEERGEGEFPYLVVQKANSKIGIIRVADFRETVYPKTCMQAWEKYKSKIKAKCNEDCQEQFLYYFIRDVLVDNFYKSLENVRSKKIDSLVVDLTNNGGGTNWVEDITALLTTKSLTCGKSGFVKHPHHAKNFKKLLAEVKRNSPDDKERISEIDTNFKIASEACDRTPLWTKKGHKLQCTLVGYGQGESCKYNELKYPGKKKYSGKLFLLVNGNTASAAEDIVARHLDSKTATVIGSRTHGSGCGYMNGGIKCQLPNTRLNVHVPDCVRARTDGTNEVVGIEPDIKMDMSLLKTEGFLHSLVLQITAIK